MQYKSIDDMLEEINTYETNEHIISYRRRHRPIIYNNTPNNYEKSKNQKKVYKQ